MLKLKVPLWLALPVILAIGVTFFSFANDKAEASTSKKPKVWSNEECLSCHTNDRVLHLMQSKRGDQTYCQAAYDTLKKLQDPKSQTGYGSK